MEHGITESRANLWLDGNNLPVKYEDVSLMPTGGRSSPHEVTSTASYSDWGKPVDIATPSREQISNVPPGE